MREYLERNTGEVLFAYDAAQGIHEIPVTEGPMKFAHDSEYAHISVQR